MTDATNRLTAAHQAAIPARQGIHNELQLLLDKADRLASEAAAAQPEPPAADGPEPPAESEAARQSRLIAVMTDARCRGAR